jgi:hypothetical protein
VVEADCKDLHVVLRDSCVRYFTVDPPAGLAGLNELEVVCRIRFAELFGGEEAQWEFSCDFRSDAPFLCCAAPRDLLEGLRRSATSSSRRLRSIVPLFVRFCNQLDRPALSGGLWLVARTQDWTTAAYYEARQCRIVRSAPLAPDIDFVTWISAIALTTGLRLDRMKWMGLGEFRQPTCPAAVNCERLQPTGLLGMLATVGT